MKSGNQDEKKNREIYIFGPFNKSTMVPHRPIQQEIKALPLRSIKLLAILLLLFS